MEPVILFMAILQSVFRGCSATYKQAQALLNFIPVLLPVNTRKRGERQRGGLATKAALTR